MPDAEATRRFFEAIATRYDRAFARDTSELKPRMAKLVAALGSSPRDVLDLGVGTGRELPYLLDAGHRVVGVDVSSEMIALCNERARPIPCILADFWGRLPVDDASADAVIALFGSLAHAPDPGAYARLALETTRVLRPSGFLWAELPTEAWARAHPIFEDEKTGARIDVIAPSAGVWREAFAAFDVTTHVDGDEVLVVAKRT